LDLKAAYSGKAVFGSCLLSGKPEIKTAKGNLLRREGNMSS
jgi:hypothetical protein